MAFEDVHFQEIKYSDIDFRSVVNAGTFGVVKLAYWKGNRVAVKTMEAEEEKKAFRNELKQLSRIKHENIVTLFGAVSDASKACLVMEFADGGSLYDVLHSDKSDIQYSTAHALSWMLQCARGVEYLHGIKLVHRDLKSPNLLLVHPGTKLKICDFGTACEARTHMTNCTGSAAWMAPEVFQSDTYSEKCDVYSFGIMLWEVLSGRKPFDNIGGGTAFAIMWKVHEGVRPPLIFGLPDLLKDMMTSCWDKDPTVRPSFKTLRGQLEYLLAFFEGEEKHPLVEDEQSNVQAGPLDAEGAVTQVPASTGHSAASSVGDGVLDASRAMDNISLVGTQTSTVSSDNKEQLLMSSHLNPDTRNSTVSSSSTGSHRGSRLSSLRGTGASALSCGGGEGSGQPSVPYPGLDMQLQPLPPTPDSRESADLYQEHCGLANDFLDIRSQIEEAYKESAQLDRLLLRDKQDAESGKQCLRRMQDLLELKERLISEHAEVLNQIKVYEG